MRGLFITFEGPEGSGKSTQARWLAEFLEQQGYAVVLTREPGGTPIGDQIRQILLNRANHAMHSRTEVLLFQASRAQHVEELICPALKAGKIVICDRYADSTLAYQGYGRGEDVGELRRLIEYATGGLWPDLTLWLDLPVEAGLARIAPDRRNRLDAEALAFHRKVHAGYAHLAAAEPHRWVRVAADRPREEVRAAVRAAVLARLQQPIPPLAAECS